MACPKGHFHEYDYTGIELPNDELAFAKVEYDKDKFLNIRAGYYIQFIEPKKSGLTVVIESSPNFDLSNNDIVKEVKSSVFGKLKKVDSMFYSSRMNETGNSLTYNLNFENSNETKMLKKIEADTISIVLLNGKILEFIRKSKT
ncbi:hypothetical protein [Winogradskyella luteola]|uniref:Uncharacterized protein n=1 Tax=Winogradskyella luteola TaxID=2828330 RepID=A0A9X1F5Y0_9FLAO|nr:hypothetical protein [Winogradskyella luteola]MBV7267977.1 hypothetical protein [Winogradskyella luteola]